METVGGESEGPGTRAYLPIWPEICDLRERWSEIRQDFELLDDFDFYSSDDSFDSG